NVSQNLKESDNGKRLSAYADLYAKPESQYVSELTDALIAEKTRFGQYWAIQALDKIQQHAANSISDPNVLSKLKTFYNQLENGVDRKFELGRILPGLKN
ncbi:MAG TPA: hypothetical protein VFV08_06705, partial [Puia sp.]|nr:hypothetical protein [Puia sp.]